MDIASITEVMILAAFEVLSSFLLLSSKVSLTSSANAAMLSLSSLRFLIEK
jgi:hypothetical protein